MNVFAENIDQIVNNIHRYNREIIILRRNLTNDNDLTHTHVNLSKFYNNKEFMMKRTEFKLKYLIGLEKIF